MLLLLRERLVNLSLRRGLWGRPGQTCGLWGQKVLLLGLQASALGLWGQRVQTWALWERRMREQGWPGMLETATLPFQGAARGLTQRGGGECCRWFARGGRMGSAMGLWWGWAQLSTQRLAPPSSVRGRVLGLMERVIRIFPKLTGGPLLLEPGR